MKLYISLDLTAAERLALERALYPGESRLLQRSDGQDWAERVLRWRLREMLAAQPDRMVVLRQFVDDEDIPQEGLTK